LLGELAHGCCCFVQADEIAKILPHFTDDAKDHRDFQRLIARRSAFEDPIIDPINLFSGTFSEELV
jgi:hypothetical protein